MATNEILTVYKAQAEEHIRQINEIVEASRRATKEKEAGEAVDKASVTTAVSASQKRKQAIEQEQAILAKLNEAKKKAFTVTEIDAYNKKIAESEKNIKTLEGATKKTATSLQSGFKLVGQAIVAAFAVEKVIAFGKECVQAFLQAELSARKLQSAVSVSGGLQSDFERLVGQSKELQSISIFSDEAIQGVQTAALQFGLTGDEVSKLTPLILDFASATGQDLNSALDNVLRGIEGQTRGLKLYGVTLKDGGTRAENLSQITSQLNNKFNEQAKIVGDTTAGSFEKYKNKVDDLQEELGAKLAPKLLAIKEFFFEVAEGANVLVDSFSDLVNADTSILNPDNWGGAREEADKFNRVFKDTFDLVKKADAKRSTESIKSEISGLFKLQSEQAGEERTRTLATISALRQILEERKKANATTATAFDVEKATTAELQKQLDILSNKTDLGSRDLVDRINKELEARKKAAGEIGKLEDERRKKEEESQKALEKFTLQSFLDNVTAAETAAKEKARVEATSAEDLQARLEQIEIDGLEEQRKILIDFGQSTVDIDKQIEDKKLKKRTDGLKAWQDANDDFKNEYIKWANDLKEADDKILSDKIKKTEDTMRGVFAIEQQFGDLIRELNRSAFQERISQLQAEKDEQLASIDERQQSLDNERQKKLIGERSYEKESAKLKEQRVAKEKEINKKIAAEKRRQAIIERELAIFNIIIHTAEAMLKVAAQSGVLTFAFSPLIAALGALEIATVLAAPLPKFKRGGFTGRGSMRDETGDRVAGIVHENEFVLNRETTQKNRRLINALHDDEIDKFINQQYILPALIAQKRKFEDEKNRDFAANIADSFLLNARSGGIDEYAMGRALGRGTNIRNVDELGKSIAKHLQSRYSAYH